ncbi:hypothetical protein CXB49_13075 [Chromobacterium sp. ATCC 53434]|uniref:hypothetical protein n=1 Tax=Chromobacterium sp. (strain ATCC 53434 / SC 14030) TaxID=2059672 RepID=UPI000C7570C9|nr:hypothetical protein [Chromobacterium sp. ATCC 53434]AUH51681.1 hypothetical protein CXB49_13075 [Chromobacterium sp. ATCC 53434]
MHRQSPIYVRIALLAACLLPAGCGSVDAGKFSAWSEAARQVESGADASFDALERDARDSAVLTAPDRKIGREGFPLLNAQGESYDLATPLGRLRASLDMLCRYADALAKLAGAGNAADVDHSAQDLAASLRSLQGSGISAATANGLSTAVDAYGQALLASARKDGLRRTMDRAQPGLDRLAEEMRQALPELRLYLQNIKLRYLGFVDADGVRPRYGSWARYQFDQGAAGQLAQYDRLDQALGSADRALQAFPDTHRQLRRSLDDPGERLERLRDFIAEARRLRGFYRALPGQ